MRSILTDFDKLLSRGPLARGFVALVAPCSHEEQVEEARRQRDAEWGMTDLPSVDHLEFLSRGPAPVFYEPPPPVAHVERGRRAQKTCGKCKQPGHQARTCGRKRRAA